MRELDLTFDDDEIGLDTAASIVSGELETNSTFEVEQSGSVEDLSLQYSASMNNISVFQTGSMIHVTGRAQENIADEIETALRNQAGRTSLGTDVPQSDSLGDDIPFSEVDFDLASQQQIANAAPYYIAEIGGLGMRLLGSDAFDELSDRVEREIAGPMNYDDARGEFIRRTDMRPSDETVIIKSEAQFDEVETPQIEKEPPEVGRTESAAGGARATELLPNDSGAVATMTLYDTGHLVIDYQGETEMYPTVAGIFIGEDNEVAQAYTHRFGRVDQTDVDEIMSNIMEVISDESNGA